MATLSPSPASPANVRAASPANVGAYDLLERKPVRIKRPRSTPAHATRHLTHYHLGATENGLGGRMNRPKTAAAVLGMNRDNINQVENGINWKFVRPRSAMSSKECDRVSQLEHESTRRHNLDCHMPVKKNKPPPWQKNIDPPLVPFVTGPGYILSRSKSKFSVTLKDEFFDPVYDDESKKTQADSEKDALISQLQEQISDLTLYLEEERLNHRQTKQKADEFLQDKVDELQTAMRNALREAEINASEELETARQDLESEHDTYRSGAEAMMARMKKEIEFLQGAFDSYKSSLHQETDAKWNQKKEELMAELEEKKVKEMHELKMKYVHEKTSEKSMAGKDHHKALDNLRKEHKRELDALVRKFSNTAADLERLTKCTAELEETKQELGSLKERYDETCQQLTNVTRTLTDSKVRLISFEEQFDVRVLEVDEKYKQKMHDLMTQNTELKRLYVQKCGELYDEKNLFERDRQQRVMTAQETMQSMLRSKLKADVSFTPGADHGDSRERRPKVRPGSAPSTREETQTAQLSAGELDHLHVSETAENVRPIVLLPEDAAEIEELRRTLMQDVREMSREDLLNTIDDTV